MSTGDRPAEGLRRHRPLVPVPRPQVSTPRVRRPPTTVGVWVLALVVVLLGVVLLLRLAQLQLAAPQEAAEAAAVSTRELHVPAVRGRILAADGTPLVGNAPSTVVTVDPARLLEAEDEGRALVLDVARALDLPADQLWGRTRLCGTADAPPVPACFSGSPYQPVPLAHHVDPVAALALLERPEDFPGIDVRTVPVRDHPAPEGISAAHVLGYLGRPTQEEVEASDGGVGADDRVGRAGLEAAYDDVLRGTPGRTTVAVDARGVVTGQLARTDPSPGSDLRTHLDTAVQAAAEQALADTVEQARDDGAPARSAAAVVMDPRDGAVLAAASWPTYDPSVWTGDLSTADYQALVDPEQGAPLVDRVLARTFPPASTFKAFTLLAALQTGVDPGARHACPGAVTIAGQRFTNYESEEFGRLTLPEVLEVSCDTTFYRWAYEHWQQLGGLGPVPGGDGEVVGDAEDRFLAVARGFGLGRPTGVDLPGEAPGTLPSRAWKREYWEATREESCRRAEDGYPEVADRERREFLEQLAVESCADGWQWRPGDAVNLSIGQGDVSVTPLQLAVGYAAVANGGRLVAPRVAASVSATDGEVLREIDPEQVGAVSVPAEDLAVVRAGLAGVTVRGTAAQAFRGWPHEDLPVAGKTGSAEVLGQTATSWFASYGPVQDPRYVVVVLVEEGGLGGDAAAPAARRIWETLRLREDG
ncbi:penicillin-binding protein 2 [Ornithinimicrobium sp. W1679]|uniref:penicillin-binding protein 2 n=1 Tax=Ornithinimicrobium sp. W1679 TaxID=3418770 RepID=UPI003CEB26D9